MLNTIKSLLGHLRLCNSWLQGLHCCGDLTPTLLKSFLATPTIKMAAILSCCYHKMALPASFPLAASHRHRLHKHFSSFGFS